MLAESQERMESEMLKRFSLFFLLAAILLPISHIQAASAKKDTLLSVQISDGQTIRILCPKGWNHGVKTMDISKAVIGVSLGIDDGTESLVGITAIGRMEYRNPKRAQAHVKKIVAGWKRDWVKQDGFLSQGKSRCRITSQPTTVPKPGGRYKAMKYEVRNCETPDGSWRSVMIIFTTPEEIDDVGITQLTTYTLEVSAGERVWKPRAAQIDKIIKSFAVTPAKY